MSTPVSYAGVSYSIPAFGDVGYAQGPGNLSSYLIALAANYTTTTALPATSGQIRLAKTDTIDWRNNLNTLNLPLAINGSDQLTFNGSVISTTTINGTVNTGTQFQLAYYATSTNTVSGLTLITASRALASDANGLPVASVTTANELAFVNGVTSAIQTQINAKATDSLVVHLAGSENVTGAKTFNAGAGAITMSGSTIAMGSNKITGLAAPSTTGDALSQGNTASVTDLTVTTTSILNGVNYTLNSGADVALTPCNGGIYVVRDTTNGGGALIIYENNSAPVIVGLSSSGTVFVTGSPTSTQIQLKAGGSLTGMMARAGSSRNGATLTVSTFKNS
jgi:hypothetical protein